MSQRIIFLVSKEDKLEGLSVPHFEKLVRTLRCAPGQKGAKRRGFVAFPRRMAGVGQLNTIREEAFPVAVAVQETCSSEMLGGHGADFLR